MRVLVSGASGMVGSALVAALRERGDEVHALVRGEASEIAEGDVRWDPMTGTVDEQALAAGCFDAVLHLAGETLMGRWDDAKRERILRSRVAGTRALSEAIAKLEGDARPSALLCASATGFYGDRSEELLSEDATPGSGFLADVVQQWEAASAPASDAGVRVALMRMAPVQSTSGGALAQLLTPFKFGVGGRVGSGRQWWPWIGLEELVRIWLFALEDERAAGPINIVGPTPARNSEYTKALGRALHRPTLLPTPTPMLKLMMGGQLVQEMLLTSQKVVPSRLEGLDYEFLDRTIDQAFARELAR